MTNAQDCRGWSVPHQVLLLDCRLSSALGYRAYTESFDTVISLFILAFPLCRRVYCAIWRFGFQCAKIARYAIVFREFAPPISCR